MHRRTRRHGVTALTAAIALAIPLGAVGVTTGVLGGAADDAGLSLTPAAEMPSAGRLVLATGATDSVTFIPPTGSPSTQPLGTGRNCLLATDGSLLEFAGSSSVTRDSNVASFGSDSIGVAEKKSGTSCTQVGATTQEVLTLSLGPVVAPASGLPVLVRSAVLDVELKQGARILATAYRAGDPVAYFDLAGGSTPKTPVLQTDLWYGFERAACGDRADNGPDAGSGDNCQWPIVPPSADTYFDSISLAAISGSFSLEGGADWPAEPVVRSTFDLVTAADGILDCRETLTLDASVDSTTPAVTLTRLDNADPADPCTRIPYRFSNSTQSAELLKPLDQDASAQFIFDFTWTGPANTDWTDDTVTSNLLARTVVDFDSDELADDETPIAMCPDLAEKTITVTDPVTNTSTEKVVQFVQNVASNDAAEDQAPGYPASGDGDTKQFACIVTQSALVTDDDPDTVSVEERIYVYGDIRLSKP
jgi:hypothetical protein